MMGSDASIEIRAGIPWLVMRIDVPAPRLIEKDVAELFRAVTMTMSDKPDADPVHERVDQVIQDMSAGRVIPRKVDELGTAVERAKRDQAVHRVTRTTL